MAKVYRVDKGNKKTGAELLAFAQKRYKENNKGVSRPNNINKAIWFLRLSGAYGKGGKSHRIELKLESEREWKLV